MGTIIHHAIVATTWQPDEDFSELVALVGDRGKCWVCPPVVNNYRTFFLAPDGSKENWPPSDDGDALRNEVVAWLEREDFYGDWCEIAMGELSGGRGAMVELHG